MKFINFIPLIATISNIVKAEIIYSCKEKKTIALTFDDGPYKYTKELVDYIVDQTDAKVTFFHVAEFHYPFAYETEEFQNAMKKAHDNGLQIASHTWGHNISSNTNEFKKSLTDMDDFIEKVTGDRPYYFRAPKGECDENCQNNLDKWNYRLIQWDTDTNDWDLESSGSAEKRVEDSIKFLKEEFAKEKDSYLILMHDSQDYTVHEIAPWIIEKSGMKEKGYRFVTVAECLGEKDHMYVSGQSYNKNEKTEETNSTSSSSKPNKDTNNNDKDNDKIEKNENIKNVINISNSSTIKNETTSANNNTNSNTDTSTNNNTNSKNDISVNNKDDVNGKDNESVNKVDNNNKDDVNSKDNENVNKVDNNNNNKDEISSNSNNIIKGNDTNIITNEKVLPNYEIDDGSYPISKPLNLIIFIILSLSITFTLLK